MAKKGAASKRVVSATAAAGGQKGYRCLQLVNLFFGLSGALIVAMGVWAATSAVAEVVGIGIGLTVIVMGAFIMFTAMLGHCGAKKDNKCCLLLYFLIVFCSLVTQLGVTATGLNSNTSALTDRFSRWWDRSDEAILAEGQSRFDCCGFNDPDDRPAAACNETEAAVNGTSVVGCRTKAVQNFQDNMFPAMLVTFLLAALQLGALTMSCRIVCRRTKTPSHGLGASVADWNTVDWDAYAEVDDTHVAGGGDKEAATPKGEVEMKASA
eukprot:PLAT10374.1.p2 GENE.PLAT10374.1~~PLAT10374.1.p2  ORF type:complete len:276 (-),score=116.36 PLAT10374.1:141-941(-)